MRTLKPRTDRTGAVSGAHVTHHATIVAIISRSMNATVKTMAVETNQTNTKCRELMR